MTVPGILKKINDIAGQVGSIKKSGYDENNEYWYFTEADIKEGISSKMIEHGVVNRVVIKNHIQENTWDKNGRNRPRDTIEAQVIFSDIDDGSEFATEVIATGSDIGGDKAPRKLHTQAKKIAYIDVFNIVDGARSIDADGQAEQEPLNMSKDEESTAPATGGSTAPRTANEMKSEVGDIIKSKDEKWSMYDAQTVSKIGKRHAKIVLGDAYTDAYRWNTDARVLELVLKSIKAGEVE